MRYLTVLCTILTCLPGGAIAAEMSHEETVVRTAYAKFAYAAEQQVVGELAMDANGHRPLAVHQQYAGKTSEQRLADAQVIFKLNDFVVGNIQDILNRKALDLISLPEEETLETNLDTMTYSDLGQDAHWTGLRVHWEPAPAIVIPPSLSSITMDETYSLQWNKPRPANLWQRYASYTVVVSYQGKTRGPYRALFIFGHGDKGNEVVQPFDRTADTAGLGSGLHESLFPDAFVITRLRTLPVVANWLDEKSVADPSCSVGKGDVCCDLVKLKCGPGRVDVIQGRSKLLPSEIVSKP